VPRYRAGPAPTREELLTLPLHVLVRDWPELDPGLREGAGELERVGHLTLPEALRGEEAPLERQVKRMESDTAWRRPQDP
jgi:hypothetical protein